MYSEILKHTSTLPLYSTLYLLCLYEVIHHTGSDVIIFPVHTGSDITSTFSIIYSRSCDPIMLL